MTPARLRHIAAVSHDHFSPDRAQAYWIMLGELLRYVMDLERGPLPPDRIKEMRQFIAKYGPANGWTGTTGTAATYINELLEERNHHGLCSESVPARSAAR